MGEYVKVKNVETKSNGHRSPMTSLDIAKTMRSFGVELQRYRVDNVRLIKAQEEQN